MKSIEFIKKEMDLLYENSNNYTSNEYLIMSNKLKKEYETSISNKKPLEYFYYTEQLLDFDYYYYVLNIYKYIFLIII